MIKILLSAVMFFAVLTAPLPALAFDLFPPKVCPEGSTSAVCADPPGNQNPVAQLINSITKIVALFVGVIAVLAIILGGFWYITAGGDSGKIAKARTTIVYALVGAVVTALAATIIIFFTGRLLK